MRARAGLLFVLSTDLCFGFQPQGAPDRPPLPTRTPAGARSTRPLRREYRISGFCSREYQSREKCIRIKFDTISCKSGRLRLLL